MAFENKQVSKW